MLGACLNLVCIYNKNSPPPQKKNKQVLALKNAKLIFWGVLIDKYITINANSKTVFTDYAMLKLVFYSPHTFSLFCQS